MQEATVDLVLEHVEVMETMDEALGTLRDAWIAVSGTRITALGRHADGRPPAARRRMDGRGLLVTPGLVNTHHHFYQTLTRNLPGCQNAKLFDWLVFLYDIWGKLEPEDFRVSALTACAELLKTGCTCSVDHLYLVPGGTTEIYDAEIEAAAEIGMRLHLCRGSMSLSRKDGGLPPDHVVQRDEEILEHCRELVDERHDDSEDSMLRIVMAPCSPFSVTPGLMKEAAAFARERRLTLHTHLAETRDEEEYCLEKYGKRPVELMEELDWIGPDVFFAHCVWLDEKEIRLFAERGVGVAHCPTSNMRLGSGVAPIKELLEAGAKVGLAVDGSASNDSSDMLAEVRNALLLQRVAKGADALTPAQALRMATIGGAETIGRSRLGKLAPGWLADFIGMKLHTVHWAGALADPPAAPILCRPPLVDLSVVNGRVVVEDGRLTTVDEERLIAEHEKRAARLLQKA